MTPAPIVLRASTPVLAVLAGVLCAESACSLRSLIGLQLQNTNVITTASAGPVTIYITSITVTPPP
jgi:hypothetical protein